MAWKPDYCTTAELKAWLRIGDAADDTLLAVAITAASRAVDGFCNRQFGDLTSAVTRYYTWDGTYEEGRALLLVDDLYTTTQLVVGIDTDGDGDADATVTSGTHFDLWPANAAADSVPWVGLQFRPATTTPLNRYARGVEIAARWGWAAVPSAVKQATLEQASRFFNRRNAPFGVAGSPDLGSELRLLERLDPDVAAGLGHLIRPWGAA